MQCLRNAVTDTTNDLLTQNAAMLKQNALKLLRAWHCRH